MASRANAPADVAHPPEGGAGADPTSAEENSPFATPGLSAASALQQLLCKLGGSIDDAGLMSFVTGTGTIKAKYKTLVQQLQNPSNDDDQLHALNELNEMLSISQDDQLAGFPVDSVVPVLVKCLLKTGAEDAQSMLQAARAITWLADVLPASCASLVAHDAVGALCTKLITIEFIDVAEQSLQGLEKISVHNPGECLRKGGMEAVLNFLDFFPTAVQRSAVSTAAAMALKLSADTMPEAMKSMAKLLNLTMYQDTSIVDSACLALSRIATAAAKDVDLLHGLSDVGLVERGLSILEVNDSGGIHGSVTPKSFFLVVEMLKTCAAGSPAIAGTLLQGGIHTFIHRLLAHSGTALANGASSSAVKSQQQLAAVLDLLSALLPGLPPLPGLVEGAPSELLRQFYAAGGPAARARFFADNPDLLTALGELLLPLLHRIYVVQEHSSIRCSCIGAVIQLVYHSSPEQLSTALEEVPISSFLVRLLSITEAERAVPGIVLAELLLDKLADTFGLLFVKEGTYNALEKLATLAPPPPPVTLQVRTRSMAKSPPQPEPVASPPTTIQHCGQRAQRLVRQYFSNASRLDTEGLTKLRELIGKLKADRNGDALQQLIDVMANGSFVSTYEMSKSGVIEAVTEHICGSDISAAGPMATTLKLHRLQHVVQVMLPDSSVQPPPLVHLIKKLTAVLEASEAFLVSMTPLPTFMGSTPYGRRHPAAGQMSPYQASLYALTQPLKLRLQRTNATSSLRDYSSSTVLVEPLAKLSTVEDFLWSRTRMEGGAHGAEDGSPQAGAGGGSTSQPQPAPSRSAAPAPPPPPPQPMRRVTRSQSAAASAMDEAPAAPAPPPPAPFHDGADAMMDGDQRNMELNVGGSLDEDDQSADDQGDEPMDDDDDDDDDDHLHGDGALPMLQHLQLPETVDGAAAQGAPAPLHGQAAATPTNARANNPWNAVAAAAAPRKLVFLANNVPLPPNTTILQAVLKGHTSPTADTDADPSQGMRTGSSIWDGVHTLLYAEPKDVALPSGADAAGGVAALASGVRPPRGSDAAETMLALVHAAADSLDLSPLSPTATSQHCLTLLRLLEQVVQIAPHLQQLAHAGRDGAAASSRSLGPATAWRGWFYSTGLNSKMMQQLKDTVALCAGTLPQWAGVLPSHYRFLFPFETRRRFLLSTAFTTSRTLNFLQQLHAQQSGEPVEPHTMPEMRVARQPRQKVRVSRSRILDSAVKVFSLHSMAKNVLEFEFFNEVGTGLGPTLEFYTLLATELKKKSLGMWRDHSVRDGAAEKTRSDVEAMSVDASQGHGEAAMDIEEGPEAVSGQDAGAASGSNAGDDEDLVYTSYGLFPRPYPPGQCPRRVISLFDMLGKAVVKCLQDGRMLDLQLAPSFYRAILGYSLNIFDLEQVDPGLAASLFKLKHAISMRTGNGPVVVDGCPVEDLALTFVLPGFPEYELVKGGKEMAVTSSNVPEYLDLVVNAFIETGIRAQLDAFVAAANTVFDIQVLRCLYEDELEMMLCGQGEVWNRTMLLEAIKCDHGYTRQSAPVQHLVDVLCEMDQAQQRAFLRFITGSPRLPPGGLAALSPRLTIVCKRSSGNGNSPPLASQAAQACYDHDLPSVMTCANYMKLPPYTSKEVCRERLMYAVNEGQGSFDLS